MPYEVKKYSNGWYVVKKTTREKMSKMPFKTMKAAKAQLAAIGISSSKKKNK